MLLTIRAASLGVICLALTQTAGAQSDPSLRAQPQEGRSGGGGGGGRQGGPNSLAAFFFPSPPPATVKDGFTYALLGDISQVGPVAQPPAAPFEKVLQIVRRADFVLANQEGTAFDYKSMPWIQGSGMFPMDSGAPRDIKAMGVQMVTVANNHGADYGPGGLLENLRLLQAAGLRYAGAGNNLREARAATLITTPKGRVTVVAAAGTFKDGFSAVDGRRGGDDDRAGISLVRTTPVYRVTAKEMALLQQLNAMRQDGQPATPDTALPQRLTVLGQTYLLGDAPGISWQMNPVDQREIVQAVHTAKQNSDFTVFTIHAHQSATGQDDNNPVPADYLVELFHSVVDAGADVVAGHGNHLFRGIEIYKGKPIFYDVASFSFSGRPGGVGGGTGGGAGGGNQPPGGGRGNQPAAGRGSQPPAAPASPSPSPAQMTNAQLSANYMRALPGGEFLSMWEGFFATTEWEGGKLKEIRIYPIDLNPSPDKPKGPAAFASPAVARKILGELRRISAPFGTNVQIEGEVGIIRP